MDCLHVAVIGLNSRALLVTQGTSERAGAVDARGIIYEPVHAPKRKLKFESVLQL